MPFYPTVPGAQHVRNYRKAGNVKRSQFVFVSTSSVECVQSKCIDMASPTPR